MKLSTNFNPVESSFEENGSFTIKASAKAFKILSDGLYSNKIKAVIRELSCNAIDAHVEAGKKELPIEIHLPNLLEPYFSVRDYGIGMSQDTIETLYSTYFDSTKTDSNDQIGALGLGSKSPFSYTDAFSIISTFNGERKTYAVCIGSNGEPMVPKMIHSEETDDCNGFEVKMAVKENDFSSFSSEASILFRPFEVKPIITGKVVTIQEYKEHLGFKTNRCLTAVQGNIEYPIDTDQIGSHISKGARSILLSPLVLHFDIGDLDVSASRESVSYDKQTKINIENKLEEIFQELKETIETETSKTKSLFEASNIVSDFYRETEIELEGLEFQNKEIHPRGNIYYNNKDWKNSVKKYIYRNFRPTLVKDDYGKTRIGKKDIFVYDDAKSKSVRRARTLTDSGHSVFLFSTMGFLDSVGNPEYIKASEIKEETKEREKGKHFKRTPTHYWSERFKAGEYVDEDYVGLVEINYYVPLYSNQPEIKGSSFNLLCRVAKKLGIIESETEVIGVKRNHVNSKAFKERTDMVRFDEYVISKMESTVDLENLRKTSKLNRTLRDLDNISYKIRELIENKSLKDEIFYLNSEDIDQGDIDIINFCEYLGKIEPESKSEVIEKYPLLKALNYSATTDGILDYVNSIYEYKIILSKKTI